MSRAAHATHSHEYGGVIQLIVMSQTLRPRVISTEQLITRLTLIMKRVDFTFNISIWNAPNADFFGEKTKGKWASKAGP